LSVVYPELATAADEKQKVAPVEYCI